MIQVINFVIFIFPVISILPIIPILIYIIIATSAVELWYHSIFYYTKLKDWLFNHYWDLSIRTNIPSQCDFESITIGKSCSFHILCFPLLESIQIGKCSFYDYYGRLQLCNLPALQSIPIGSINSESSYFVYYSLVIQNRSIHFILLITRSPSTSTYCLGLNGFQSIIHNHFRKYSASLVEHYRCRALWNENYFSQTIWFKQTPHIKQNW